MLDTSRWCSLTVQIHGDKLVCLRQLFIPLLAPFQMPERETIPHERDSEYS